MMLQTGFGHASRKSTSCKGDIHKTSLLEFDKIINSYYLLFTSKLIFNADVLRYKRFYKESTRIHPSVIYSIDRCIWYYMTISCSRGRFWQNWSNCRFWSSQWEDLIEKETLRTSVNFHNFWPLPHLVSNRGGGVKNCKNWRTSLKHFMNVRFDPIKTR